MSDDYIERGEVAEMLSDDLADLRGLAAAVIVAFDGIPDGAKWMVPERLRKPIEALRASGRDGWWRDEPVKEPGR